MVSLSELVLLVSTYLLVGQASQGRPIGPINQVKRFVNEICNENSATFDFPSARYPMLYEEKGASLIAEILRQRTTSLKSLPNRGKERLEKLPLFNDFAFQLRAIKFYPPCTNQYTRSKYLLWVTSNLELFNNPRNWHLVMAAYRNIPQFSNRLPRIFTSVKEEDLKGQYCAYLCLTKELKSELKQIIPAIATGRIFECDSDEKQIDSELESRSESESGLKDDSEEEFSSRAMPISPLNSEEDGGDDGENRNDCVNIYDEQRRSSFDPSKREDRDNHAPLSDGEILSGDIDVPEDDGDDVLEDDGDDVSEDDDDDNVPANDKDTPADNSDASSDSRASPDIQASLELHEPLDGIDLDSDELYSDEDLEGDDNVMGSTNGTGKIVSTPMLLNENDDFEGQTDNGHLDNPSEQGSSYLSPSTPYRKVWTPKTFFGFGDTLPSQRPLSPRQEDVHAILEGRPPLSSSFASSSESD
jgi:hypothetical protein